MQEKHCPQCDRDLPIDEFYFRNRKKGTRQPVCKECRKALSADHYQRNKQHFLDKRKRKEDTTRRFLFDHLSSHPCECGEDNPVLLEFAHLNGKEKSFSLCVAVKNGYSIERIKREIAKCRILCVRCHRLETAEQQGWFKDLSDCSLTTW